MERLSRKLSLTKNKAKVLVLASGGGTTFEALVREAQKNSFNYEVVGVVTNRRSAGVIQLADNLNISSHYIPFDSDFPEEFFDDVLELAEEMEVDFIALAGFLLLIREPLLSRFSGKILNTHPALLPKFGGKGLYGDHVHQAVLDAGEKESGVTVHLVNENYDEGQILGAEKVDVLAEDDLKSLSERVRAVQRVFFPKVLNQFVTTQGFG